MTCWFCKQEVPTEKVARVETSPEFSNCGYCFCKDCLEATRNEIELLSLEILWFTELGMGEDEAISFVCYGG